MRQPLAARGVRCHWNSWPHWPLKCATSPRSAATGTVPQASQSSCRRCALWLCRVLCRLSTSLACHSVRRRSRARPLASRRCSTRVWQAASRTSLNEWATHSCTAPRPSAWARSAGFRARPLPKPGKTALPSNRSMLALAWRRSCAAGQCCASGVSGSRAPKCRHTGMRPVSHSIRTQLWRPSRRSSWWVEAWFIILWSHPWSGRQ